MLYDRARVRVEAGAGGDGAVSFRREAHVSRGGPDGGDGGDGGDVVLVCDPSLRDLQDFRGRGVLRAGRGGHGQGSNRHGAVGETLELRVPPGTVAGSEDGSFSYDLTTPGARAVVAAGGSGGRGNRRFTTARRQAPRFAERGLPGEERWVELRLKLLADAGLVGLPNAGKSSLLARLTRARPKVAGYPFTTLHPALGTIEADKRQVVVADIPGLIEGAGEGAGLGYDFLAHVERTRLLVQVVELTPQGGVAAEGDAGPETAHAVIETELASYGRGLERLPRLLCLSKADLVPSEEAEAARAEWARRLDGAVLDVVLTSAATGQGIEDLRAAIVRHVPDLPVPAAAPGDEEQAPAEHRLYRPGSDQEFHVERVGGGSYRVLGPRVERLVARHDLGNEDALRHVEERLTAMGVVRALEAQGFEPGDDLEIAGVQFELDPGAPFG